ncbi:MAG: hypothetical protein ACR2H2_19640 [Solirubrobacteraceae bacterium]
MRAQDTLIGLDAHHTPEAWAHRLQRDAREIARRLPPELLGLHSAVVDRAREAAAHGLILSGSTARCRRTAISDLDYHLIGPQLFTRDLSSQLDLHILTPTELDAHILGGDDFVQWSLRFGLIVFDDDHLRRAAALIANSKPWPDAYRKRNTRLSPSASRAAWSPPVTRTPHWSRHARHSRSLPAHGCYARASSPERATSCRSSWRSLAYVRPARHSHPTIHNDTVPLADLALAVDLCDVLISPAYDAVSIA